MSGPHYSYAEGTLSVDSGATTVTGTGTAWSTTIKGGDEIWAKVDSGTRGPEKIIDGGFESSAFWNEGAGWSVAGGIATKVPGTLGDNVQFMTLAQSRAYEITFDVVRATAGSVQPRFRGGGDVAGTARTAPGTYTEVLTAIAGNDRLAMRGDAAFDGDIDNVSLRELPLGIGATGWVFVGMVDGTQTIGDLTFDLQDVYPGAGLSGTTYRIKRGIAWLSGAQISETLSKFLTELGPMGLAGSSASAGAPAASEGRENQIHVDDDLQLYQKRSGIWLGPVNSVPVLSTLTVNIPTDYATLQAAIDALSHRPNRQDAKIILNIESGHVLTAGVDVRNGDYSRFWIQSVDAEVTLDAAWADITSVLYGKTARMPVLDCLINAGGKGRVGVWIDHGSTFYATEGSGVKNMSSASLETYAGTGLRIAHGSSASVVGTIFSGARNAGIVATHAVNLQASMADLSGSGMDALFMSRGAIVHGQAMNLSNAARYGLRVARSYASIRGSNLQNAGEFGILAFEGSTVAAREANCSGAGIDGIKCYQGGAIVDISAGTISNCVGRGIIAIDGSKVIAEGATLSGNGGSAISVGHGSTVSARGAIIDALGAAVGTNAVVIEDGSSGSFTLATISNAPGNGLRVEDGSVASAASATFTASGTNDLSVTRGATISADGAAYSTTSQAPNAFTRQGVIFDTTKAAVQYYSKGDVLGTVSQTSGVPTGAVIERGSNANGTYVRFADGTQLCWKYGASLAYINSTLIGVAWTFPAAFINTNVALGVDVSTTGADFVSVAPGDVGVVRTSVGSGASKTVGLSFVTGTTPSSSAVISGCTLRAEGRWF